MKVKKIVDTTTNRRVYNRALKMYRENRVIHCSFCKYHRGENQTSKPYGGFVGETIRYPNWKLVSKNRKQWQKKKLRFKESKMWYNSKTYLEITF